jgi:lipid-A-disaccharide synthase
MKNILIITGEPSGDLHGGKLVQALLNKDKGLKIFAVGGEAIQAAGGHLIYDNESLGVVGLFEVLRHLKEIKKAFKAVETLLETVSIHHLILVDYPDFNLRVARSAKKMGIPISYYISPQIWAWRYKRIHLIKKLIDRMFVILPFEEAIYQKENVPVEFVGHPLIEEISPSYSSEALSKKFGLNPVKPIIGICPGSRKGELTRLLPVMLEAAMKIKKELPGAQFILPVAPTFTGGDISARLGSFSREALVIKGDSSEVMAVCDILMVASGTATLQAAILGVPMVIVYRVSPLTYWIGKLLLKIKMIGLVNIISGAKMIPELIQAEATSENIASTLLGILNNQVKMNEIKRQLFLVKEKLTDRKASERTADAILKMIYS